MQSSPQCDIYISAVLLVLVDKVPWFVGRIEALSLKTKKKRQQNCKSSQCWTNLPDLPVLGRELASSPLLFFFSSLHLSLERPKHLHLLKDPVMHTLCLKNKEHSFPSPR